MLTQEEERFVEYWKRNRLQEKKTMRQLLIGLPVGLTFALGIVAAFTSGWYQRAEMAAYSNSSPFVFLAAIAGIIAFIAIFSKKHKWDMNEQRYLELLHKQNKTAANAAGESIK
jgi:hypothetical protein